MKAADFSVAGTLTDHWHDISGGVFKDTIVYNITDQKTPFCIRRYRWWNLSITSILKEDQQQQSIIYTTLRLTDVLYVGTGGTVAVQFNEPTDNAFGGVVQNVPDASFLPIQAVRVDIFKQQLLTL